MIKAFKTLFGLILLSIFFSIIIISCYELILAYNSSNLLHIIKWGFIGCLFFVFLAVPFIEQYKKDNPFDNYKKDN